ncbi:hypothetical protein [Nonomuraea sp. KM90]|uniref:hypothetical protein n=1 Tax=Nonomuraea sp. KM90 TaxID=3457428 RepID=UPI003FCE3A55
MSAAPGPERAGARHLARLLRAHRPVVAMAVLLGLLGAGLGAGLGMAQPLLAGPFAAQAAVQAYGRYAVGRTAEHVVFGLHTGMIGGCCGCRWTSTAGTGAPTSSPASAPTPGSSAT